MLYNLLVSAEHKSIAEDVGRIIDPDVGGAFTFSVRLSSDGQEPATHYACRTYLREQTHQALTQLDAAQLKVLLDQMAADRGRDPVGDIAGWPYSLVIDDGDFYQLIQTQGLQLIL
ncbi:hypothetical protein [Nitrosomonas sp. Nm132]|uniref:hypothetical protein n=1 Tax=Nitrosomonas sp. Nm132 TaxID=1881053 RepID=UPI000881F13A|nr:hypothetical protein [Nitrosomonas sp. Nm132]SDH27193.1 hypothetical protein SAMN05428952_100973 [Nitrosomonas sp. Nm132]